MHRIVAALVSDGAGRLGAGESQLQLPALFLSLPQDRGYDAWGCRH
jgi:hypothetical protein